MNARFLWSDLHFVLIVFENNLLHLCERETSLKQLRLLDKNAIIRDIVPAVSSPPTLASIDRGGPITTSSTALNGINCCRDRAHYFTPKNFSASIVFDHANISTENINTATNSQKVTTD